MRTTFLLLFFSCILCGKAWAQPRTYPLAWDTKDLSNARTTATAVPYTTTLKLPYLYDFSSRYLQTDTIYKGSPVTVVTQRPHGLVDKDTIEISGAKDPTVITAMTGLKYIKRISDYQFELYNLPDNNYGTPAACSVSIDYLRINKIRAQESAKPDTLAFYDNHGGVRINFGSGKNQPSYYVATFDGLDETGAPYNPTTPLARGYTDSLLSHPFDFSSYAPADSIYMSYHYQHGGYGEQPDPIDHFYLEFIDTNAQWNVVMDHTGLSSQSPDVFYKAMVPIKDPKYFHDKFQYRYRSYGRQSGAYDVWNLDYIYINKNRTVIDTTLRDFTFRYGDQSFLKKYTAIPFNHFFANNHDADTVNYFHIKNSVSVFNQSQYGKPKEVNVTVIDQFKNLIAKGESPNDQDPYLERTYVDSLIIIGFPVKNQPLYADLTYSLKDSVRTDAIVATTTGPIETMFNNFITKRTYLYDYYAYDDSEAESGFGSNYPGSEIAYQFVCAEKDTLTHVDICFTRNKDENLENFQIYLMVWGDSVINTADQNKEYILYKEPISIHYPSKINGFVRYALNTPILINAGKKFHVGFQKNFAQLVTVGYDRNNDSRSRSFYKESATWYRMDTNNPTYSVSDAGSMMIRPVFYKESNHVPVGIHPSQGDIKNTLLLYPNPASTSIDIVATDELSNLNYTMYSLYGQIVASGTITSTEHTISVAQLSSGMYIIRCTDEKGTIYTSRFIKE